MVKDLVDKGFLDKILISHDVAHKTTFSEYGGYGFTHILKNIAPRLKKLNISDNEIKAILVDNPKKVLQFRPA